MTGAPKRTVRFARYGDPRFNEASEVMPVTPATLAKIVLGDMLTAEELAAIGIPPVVVEQQQPKEDAMNEELTEEELDELSYPWEEALRARIQEFDRVAADTRSTIRNFMRYDGKIRSRKVMHDLEKRVAEQKKQIDDLLTLSVAQNQALDGKDAEIVRLARELRAMAVDRFARKRKARKTP